MSNPNSRYPVNMEGLLRFALEHTKSEDALNSPAFQEMADEKRKFLESALRTMTVDIIAEFQKAIAILQSKSSSVEQKNNALLVIRDQIDNIDFANNFLKVGGAEIIITFLKSEAKDLRVTANYIVAEMSQNNPDCQKHFVDVDVIPILLDSSSNYDEDISRSAIHAVSSIVRSYEPGLIEFLQLGGINILLTCLNTPHAKLFIKTAFLIAHLSASNINVRDTFVEKNAIPLLILSVEPSASYDVKTETSLNAICELSKSPKWKMKHTEDKRKIKQLMSEIIKTGGSLPENEEIVEYARCILNNLENVND